MTLTRWSPVSRMLSPWSDLWEDDLLPVGGSSLGGMEVYETEKDVVVKLNVAGVPQDKIDITFEKGVLFVNAQLEEEKHEEKRNYYSRSTKQYSYRVAVPGEIDLGKEPDAQVDQGILTVKFAKSQAALPKKLKIKASNK